MIDPKILFDQDRWKKAANYTSGSTGNDLTIDGQINKDGAIHSHADDKMHTSKSSYMDSLKSKGLVIKDWK